MIEVANIKLTNLYYMPISSEVLHQERLLKNEICVEVYRRYRIRAGKAKKNCLFKAMESLGASEKLK